VPRSINDPLNTNNSNVTGFLNLIVASRDSKVNSLVYAASSSTYGDHPALPKVEHIIGKPLSTYAVTKYINELYADVFARNYDFRSVGLRYFNVFGKMQNPQGPYAAVIPRWIEAMIKDSEITIFGDGETSRDFCYIKNVVQANILAAFSEENVLSEVYNVAVGDRTTLNQLFEIIKNNLLENEIQYKRQPVYSDFRDGDVRHSQADISKAEKFLGYNPQFTIDQGIKDSINWYIQNLKT
jgi:UDP-N-acetylglucosamine 4-epimerase